MTSNQKKEKWNDAYRDSDIATAKPAQVLSENSFLLSNSGDALDLACGRAGNAIFLAKHGYQVDAMDNSSVVLKHIDQYVKTEAARINSIERDIENEGIGAKQYDVIVVSYFLHRGLTQQIINALKPNGLLFYQTWSQLQCDKSGPSNPNFRLKSHELTKLFSILTPLVYHEHGLVGNLQKGLRNQAMLVAQKSQR